MTVQDDDRHCIARDDGLTREHRSIPSRFGISNHRSEIDGVSPHVVTYCSLQRSAFVFDGQTPPLAFVQSVGERVSFVECEMMVEFELHVLAMQIVELE